MANHDTLYDVYDSEEPDRRISANLSRSEADELVARVVAAGHEPPYLVDADDARTRETERRRDKTTGQAPGEGRDLDDARAAAAEASERAASAEAKVADLERQLAESDEARKAAEAKVTELEKAAKAAAKDAGAGK